MLAYEAAGEAEIVRIAVEKNPGGKGRQPSDAETGKYM